MSTIETDFVGSSVGSPEAQLRVALFNGTSLLPGRDIFVSFQAGKNQEPVNRSFQGVFRIEGTNVSMPEQVFELQYRENACYIQNEPTDHCPVVRFTFDFSAGATIGEIDLRPVGRAIEAIVLATRLRYALNATGRCRLVEKPSNKVLLDVNVGRLEPSEYGDMLLYAKVSRKLRFLEEFFGTRFIYPDQFTTKDLAQLETLFRGVTEGEFSTRRSEMIFDYSPLVAELSRPPFSAPGPLSCTFSDQHFQLLDQKLETGPQTVQIDRAVLADTRDLAKLRNAHPLPGGVRFVVLDLQVKYRFEDYARCLPQEREQGLKQFRAKLLQEEPEELVQLLTEPLISEVSSERAIQIVNGWLQYYDFPDRYCPQDPVLEGDQWRVPVWITYPTVRGAKVEDLFVDVKTGVISTSLTPTEMRRLGKSIASKYFVRARPLSTARQSHLRVP